MKASIEQFRQNLVHVRNLATIHAELRQNNSGLELSDILRAELVLGVSALDTFIHDLVRLGMVEMLQGQRKRTKYYQDFEVGMNVVKFGDQNYDWFETEIQRRYGEESFQKPSKIADAIKRISNKFEGPKVDLLWEAVAEKVAQPPDQEYVKDRLKEIVERRNNIAHLSDLDSKTPGKRLDINDVYVDEVINFIEKLGEAIYKVTLCATPI